MNLLNFVKRELGAALNEATHPLFFEAAAAANDDFYKGLFNYYHSMKGKTLDTHNGESLFASCNAE
ncbi:MAG: hypothetical protein ACXWF8_14640 [Methylobacter sp.]